MFLQVLQYKKKITCNVCIVAIKKRIKSQNEANLVLLTIDC